MKVAYKVWLDKDGKAFGEGPYRLLKLIEQTGSLHQAAMKMKMSYRKAWLTIHSMEEKLGFILLDKHAGGHTGGGSTITLAGAEFIQHYEEFRDEVKKSLEDIYCKHFDPPAQ
ncbi:MAG: molybdenum-binding protein [Syntrophus sp. (in: bacteria)]|nr:molybdenum-binding protein [Syntrophus sp. (in: bacteria)]